MTKNLTYILLFVVIFFNNNIFAQKSVKLNKYRKMAVAYNQDLKAAEINKQVAQEQVKSAKADFLPKLSADASMSYTANPMELNMILPENGTPISFSGQNENYKAALSLAQPIYQGSRIKNIYKLSNIQSDIANHNKEKVWLDVVYQTDIRYWTAVAETEVLSIMDSYVGATQQLVQTVSERVEAEVVSQNDLLMAEVKLNEVKYLQKQSQTNLNNSLLSLNSFIGQELTSDLDIEDTVPAKTNVTLAIANEYHRPELQLAEKKIEAQQSLTDINDAKYRPSLNLGAEGNYSSPGYNFDSDLDPNAAIYLTLKIPIFEWKKRKHEKRANELQEEISRTEYQKVKDNITLEIESAYSNYKRAIEQVVLNQNSLEKAEENERISLERYKDGYSSITDVIDAQLFLQTTRKNFVSAKVAAQIYHSAYMRALGKYNL